MAVAFKASTSSGVSDSQGTSRTVNVPAGAAAGDVALLIMEMWESTATNPTVSYPAGFSEIVNYVSATDGFQKLKVARKVLTAADSGTYNMTWTGTHWIQAQCLLFSGVDNTTPLDVAVNNAQNASGTAFPSNALTTAAAGCGLVYVVANENSATQTPPTGYTEPANGEANYLKHSYKIAGAAGSESISGGSLSASTLKLASLIALRPAAGGGGSTAVTPATEVDAAQPAGRIRSTAVTPALETDAAQPAGRSRVTASGFATETDAAQAVGRARTTPAGPALETDAAQPVVGGSNTPVSPALEVDTAQPVGRTRTTPVTPALEVDVAGQATDPNATLRDLIVDGHLEPDRWRVAVEPDRWATMIEPDRWATEVEP